MSGFTRLTNDWNKPTGSDDGKRVKHGRANCKQVPGGSAGHQGQPQLFQVDKFVQGSSYGSIYWTSGARFDLGVDEVGSKYHQLHVDQEEYDNIILADGAPTVHNGPAVN